MNENKTKICEDCGKVKVEEPEGKEIGVMPGVFADESGRALKDVCLGLGEKHE